MSYSALAAIKERIEIDAIERMTPEHINDLLNSQHDKIKELTLELGMVRIQLNHKSILLASCEKALEDRDARIIKLTQLGD